MDVKRLRCAVHVQIARGCSGCVGTAWHAREGGTGGYLEAEVDNAVGDGRHLHIAAVRNQVRPHLVQSSIHALHRQIWRLRRSTVSCGESFTITCLGLYLEVGRQGGLGKDTLVKVPGQVCRTAVSHSLPSSVTGTCTRSDTERLWHRLAFCLRGHNNEGNRAKRAKQEVPNRYHVRQLKVGGVRTDGAVD